MCPARGARMANLVEQGVQQGAQIAQKGGAMTATGSGFWIFLAENHQAIATLGVIVGIVLGVAGFAVNWWYLHRNSRKRGA